MYYVEFVYDMKILKSSKESQIIRVLFEIKENCINNVKTRFIKALK